MQCLCYPVVDENDRIIGLKPMLLLSCLLLSVIIFIYYYIFDTYIYLYLFLLLLSFFVMVVKRHYYAFTLYTISFIFIVIPKLLNDLGTYFQVETITTTRIFIFCFKFFCFVLLWIIYYIFFHYYKELRYLYIKENCPELQKEL